MSIQEMYEAFAVNHPWYTPNDQNVGRYARKMGYKLMKQRINKKQVYFYLHSSATPNKDNDN